MDWGDGGRLCIRPDFPVRARRSHALVNWAWSCSQAGFIALRRNSRRPTSSARASSVGGTSRPSTAAGHTRYHARFGQALVWEQRRGRRTRRKFMRGAILLPSVHRDTNDTKSPARDIGTIRKGRSLNPLVNHWRHGHARRNLHAESGSDVAGKQGNHHPEHRSIRSDQFAGGEGDVCSDHAPGLNKTADFSSSFCEVRHTPRASS